MTWQAWSEFIQATTGWKPYPLHATSACVPCQAWEEIRNESLNEPIYPEVREERGF